MRFEFATAQRIIFGAGTLKGIGPIAKDFGSRALVVTGQNASRADSLLELLTEAGIEAKIFSVTGEPTVDVAQQGVEQGRKAKCAFVIGIGGGSVIDAGKAIAALATNEGDAMQYLEVIGQGKPLINPPLPYVAIPTTAGTGAEVTRNAVLGSSEHGVKVSLRSALMLPKVALVDPELTYDLPPHITASTGLDALTQLIEPFVSHQANPMTDAFCRDGIARVARSLRGAYENGSDAQAREDMALASLYGGLALANAKLGAVHGFAAPIGGMFPAPHGAVCAALLPQVMEANVRALQARQPDNLALRRYQEVAQLLTRKANSTIFDGIAWVQELCHDLQIPKLSAYGITADAFPQLIEKAAAASSMQGNPIKLTEDELRNILISAC